MQAEAVGKAADAYSCEEEAELEPMIEPAGDADSQRGSSPNKNVMSERTRDATTVPRVCGVPLKWVSLVALTLQTTVQVYTVKLARSTSKTYLNSTVVLFAELTKLVLSTLLLASERGSLAAAWRDIKQESMGDVSETLKLGVPALMYTVQNNMLFFSLDSLGAAVQQITYQLKILTAALLSARILGKVISRKRWLSLCVLVLGVVLVQLPRDVETSDSSSATTASSMLSSNHLLGFLAVLAACFTSGLAGVFMEKVLKGGSASMWLRNVQLAFFGALTAVFGIVTKDGGTVMEGGLTRGYTWGVVLMFLTVAGGGLLAAVVLKYADNILRQFSTALSLLLTSTWSATLFEESVIDDMFFVGAGLTIFATFLYNGLMDDYLPGCLADRT